MINYDLKTARAWSRMGPRAVYGQFLLQLAKENENLVALSADLGRSSGLNAFANELPSRYFNTGIAEQNLVGISAGLARSGFDVFSSTFAPFASLRAGEQVRMNMGYMQEPVKLVALASGFALGFLGNSHFGIEDIAVMRAIPGITIVTPADCFELYKCLEALVGYEYPVYLRLTGGVGMPIVYDCDYEFQVGKAQVLKEITEITVLSHGTTVGHALKAVNKLAEEGVEIGLVNMHTIKPLDTDVIGVMAEKSKKIIVFEEHSVIGGLGSSVLEYLNQQHWNHLDVFVHGIGDNFPKTGSYDYMLKTHGLDSEGVKNSILSVI